ncbi:response regulator [Pseudomonas sp. NPDC086251]|uniref:response regulator n=1 Tax=Pseudomonas sp. NPDC086251 TaxID=3364431 RepID=UPI00383608E6
MRTETDRQLVETRMCCQHPKPWKLLWMLMMSTVLIVEDAEILRSLMVEAISLLDVNVMDCASADDALPLLETSAISLVISDVNMPGSMDGIELAQLIWARWPSLPVIITSGNSAVSEERLPAHVMLLPKPCSLNTLHQAVRRYLP